MNQPATTLQSSCQTKYAAFEIVTPRRLAAFLRPSSPSGTVLTALEPFVSRKPHRSETD